MLKKLPKNFKWIISFLCLIVFLVLAKSVFFKEIIQIDTIGYNIISTYLINDTLTPIVKIITNFSSVIYLTIITIILIIFIKDKKIKLSIIVNLIIITFFNQILKFVLQRPRPDNFRIIDESGYSFPSGHAMVSMAFYGYLIYLIYINIKNKYLKYSLIFILTCLIIIIGISRIYLGVHYTSDVVAGFLVSISYLIVYTNIIKKF